MIAVELNTVDIDRIHFHIGYLDGLGIIIFIEATPYV